MSSDHHRVRGWLFGREYGLSGQFLVAAGGVYLLLVLSSHWLGDVRLPLSYGDSQYAVAVVVFAVSAIHGYLNDGLLTSIAVSYMLLLGANVAGMVPVLVANSGTGFDAVVYVVWCSRWPLRLCSVPVAHSLAREADVSSGTTRAKHLSDRITLSIRRSTCTAGMHKHSSVYSWVRVSKLTYIGTASSRSVSPRR